MDREMINDEDGVALAASVRNLAQDAHRLIQGPRADRREAEDVLRRIDGIRREYQAAGSAPIHRWLDNLRLQVERT